MVFEDDKNIDKFWTHYKTVGLQNKPMDVYCEQKSRPFENRDELAWKCSKWSHGKTGR